MENKSDAAGIKPLILREHLAMRRSSENIDAESIFDGILLDIWGIRTTKNGNLSLLSKSWYTKELSSFLLSRPKNEAWFSSS